jgi:hypothetical protein
MDAALLTEPTMAPRPMANPATKFKTLFISASKLDKTALLQTGTEMLSKQRLS